MRISVFTSPALQGTILALKGMDREVAAQVRKATKEVTQTAWSEALAAEASTPLENRVLTQTARVSVTNQNVSLKTGQAAKKLRAGGPAINTLTPAVEFGAVHGTYAAAESARGRQYKRRTKQQFKTRNVKGNVAYPAAADVIPRIAALWVQTVVRTFHESLEKGARHGS